MSFNVSKPSSFASFSTTTMTTTTTTMSSTTTTTITTPTSNSPTKNLSTEKSSNMPKSSTPVKPDMSETTFTKNKNDQKIDKSSTTLCSKDVAKNIEIRRMSATEEGDRVLDSAWDSPEKEEKGRTPLEMVQNFVSSLENDPASKTSKRPLQTSASPDPPAWTQTPSKPLTHSQTLRPNFNPPSSSVPSLIARPPTNVAVINQGLQQGSLVAAGQGMVQMPQPPSTTTTQVMQLVNTINGPMLIPEGQHLQQFQPALQSPNKSHQEPPKLMIPTMQGPHPILMSPGHQLIAIAPHQQQQATKSTTDRGSASQTSPQGHQQQQIFLNQASYLSVVHLIVLFMGQNG